MKEGGEKREAIEAAFYHQYGKTIAAWAQLECVLSRWFHRMLCYKPLSTGAFSHAVFYSGKSFAVKRDMLVAVLQKLDPRVSYTDMAPSPDADTLLFLRKAIKLANNYSTTRNAIVHRMSMFNTNTNRIGLVEGDHWWEDGLDIKELDIAEKNFTSLARLLQGVLLTQVNKAPQPITPQEALQQVLAMPKEASSDQPNQTAAKRQRRPRSSQA